MLIIINSSMFNFHLTDFYFYIETDPPRKSGDIARLKSPPFTWTKNNRVRHWFSFWYFMWGSNVNELRVLLEDNTGSKRELWSISGEQERNWLQANVSFEIPRVSGPEWYSVVFEGVAGGDQQSDIAIDTFESSASMCRYQGVKEGKE